MKSRIISSIILVALFLVIVYFAKIPFVLSAAVALLSAAALYETLIVTKYIESKALMSLSVALSLLIPFLGQIFTVLPVRKLISTSLISCIFIYVLLIFISMLASKDKFSLEHLSFVFLMTVIIPCFFSTIVYAGALSGRTCNVLFIFFCAWGSDTGGYIFGGFFGRHKIAPQISPKKTLEGAIGCIVSAAVSVVILSYIADTIYGNITVNYTAVIIYGLCGGICAILGDLFASVIKRSFGVKDFGSIIPGHGGIMDRFDSVLFTAPLIYILMTVTPVFATV